MHMVQGHKYRQNPCTHNQRTHQKDHAPRSIQLHARDTEMAQHAKIDNYNPQHKQSERKKTHTIISLYKEKAFDKPNIPS